MHIGLVSSFNHWGMSHTPINENENAFQHQALIDADLLAVVEHTATT